MKIIYICIPLATDVAIRLWILFFYRTTFSKYIERLCNIALYFLFYLFTLKKIIFLFLHFTFLFVFNSISSSYNFNLSKKHFFFFVLLSESIRITALLKLRSRFFLDFSFYIKIVFFFYNKNERRLVQYRSKRRCQ